jgi:mono/diheme cytochrome c family protein
MSWRPSNSFRPGSGSSRSPQPGSPSTLDPTLRMILIGAAALGLVVLALIVVLSNNNRQPGSSAAVQPTVRPTSTTAPAATPTSAVTRRAAATTVPVATISPATAGAVETSGNAEAGQALFVSMPSEALAAGAVNCSVCHNIEPGSGTLVGPSLSGVGTRAATRIEGLSAAQYLRTSITTPDAYLVEGFTPGIMTQTFGKALTPAQTEDLVAYLLTLP